MASLFLDEAWWVGVEYDLIAPAPPSGAGSSELFRETVSILGIMGTGGISALAAASLASLAALRFDRLGDLGRLVVMLALVALMKLVLATFRREVGRARRIRWE